MERLARDFTERDPVSEKSRESRNVEKVIYLVKAIAQRRAASRVEPLTSSFLVNFSQFHPLRSKSFSRVLRKSLREYPLND